MNYDKKSRQELIIMCKDLEIKKHSGKNKKELIELINEFNKNPVNKMNSYIYIRTNKYWDMDNVYKLGMSANTTDRERPYITCEPVKGRFIQVVQVKSTDVENIEKKLQRYFTAQGLHFESETGGGTEFFYKDIERLLVPWLQNSEFEHRVLLEKEIDELNGTTRESDIQPLETSESAIEVIDTPKYKIREYQEEIINKATVYFSHNDKGTISIPCGAGKTFISLHISLRLGCNTIAIGVPSRLLVTQWDKYINDINIFGNIKCMVVSKNATKESIVKFLQDNVRRCVLITTYASSYKVLEATREIQFKFDIKINDECHHLTTSNMTDAKKRTYVQMLNISASKQLSLTATLKELKGEGSEFDIVSNDNKEYFGEIIVQKCLLWGITKNIICDYTIQTIITSEDSIDSLLSRFIISGDEDVEKRLILAAYVALKSMNDGHSKFMLIYSNSRENSEKIIKYISILLSDKYFDISGLYRSDYHGSMTSSQRELILNRFNNSIFGIIVCVYCLTEGYDNCKIDTTVFAENMGSEIRVVQAGCRGMRKNILMPNKKATIILPLLHKDNWFENDNNSDFKKVKEIVYQMGLEDETIIQKINVSRINIEHHKKMIQRKENVKDICNFGEYDDELTQKIRLCMVKRAELGTSYEKARKIIADKNIKSKDEYRVLCNINVKLPLDPETVYNQKFTNWIEYLSIERVYYDFETCKRKINEYIILYPELKSHYLDLSLLESKLCTIDALFPPRGLWTDYYGVNLQSIFIFGGNNKKKNSMV